MTTCLRLTLALSIGLTTNGVIAIAQESVKGTSEPKDTQNVIQAVDKLIEQNQQLEKQNQQIENQNQQLEKQNQQLMEQIKVLRGTVAQDASKQEALLFFHHLLINFQATRLLEGLVRRQKSWSRSR